MIRSLYIRNQDAWRKYNQSRIDKAFEISPAKSELAFHVIPFLLQCNVKELPGYVQDYPRPIGIHRYKFDEEKTASLNRHLPRMDFHKMVVPDQKNSPGFESLLLMGSIGTVGHNRTSDHDYWLAYDETRFSEKEIAAIKSKLALLEQWGDERKIEVHFFLSDINKARVNDFGETDKESGGSSQAKILKEEFYRTAILLEGKDLMWCVFPPWLCEAEYEDHKKMMFDEGYLGEDDVIDLGAACSIPADELFGALLWQFNKAMESPHKSVLKMALLESYLDSGPKTELLCDMLKRSMQANPERSNEADPYLLMLDYIRNYYKKVKRRHDLLSVEKCFFLKCFDSPIKNAEDEEGLPYKDSMLRACVRKWKWDADTLDDMNDYKSWDFKVAAHQASSLHGFMLETYKRLTDRIATQPNIKRVITDSDLTILGRKLFTLYSRKPDKIEFLKRMKDETKWLDAISFAALFSMGRNPLWTVYRENITSLMRKGGQFDHLALNSAKDPVSLMFWLIQNKVYGKSTFLYFVPNKTSLSLKDVQELMERIVALFPPVVLKDLSPEDLLKKAYVKKVIVAVNLLEERWEKEIKTVHVLYNNSWGESYCHLSSGSSALNKLLETLNQTQPNFSISDPSIFSLYVPYGNRQATLTGKVKSFLAQKYNPYIRLSGKAP